LKKKFLDELSDGELMALPYLFEFWALEHQIPPLNYWKTWIVLGGGKLPIHGEAASRCQKPQTNPVARIVARARRKKLLPFSGRHRRLILPSRVMH
jgi:hypothetical protein